MFAAPADVFATSTPTPCDVDFRDLMSTGWVPIQTFVIKSGGLGPESQCAVVYRLDAQEDPQKVAPAEGVVYRRDHGEPPRSILAYPLRLPGRFYLGEHNVNVYTGNLITGTQWPQVVVEDWDPDGLVVEASLFQWYDLKYNDPFAPYDPKKMGYKLVGHFVGEGGIQVKQNVITVAVRIAGSRSRLAYQKTYVPDDKARSYYIPACGNLVEPETTMVALVECIDPNAACYPEKTVLDFYQYFSDDSALTKLMTLDAHSKFTQDKNLEFKYGCLSDRSQVDRVLVQGIKVQDGKPQSRVTITKGQCKLKDGKFKKMVAVTWLLERNALGKWLLKESK